MKTPMTQAFMMILAVVFATALALTVILLCMTYLRGDVSQERPSYDDTDTRTESETLPTVVLPDIVTTTLPPEEEKAPAELGNGLAFASSGDGTCTLIGIGTCIDACVVIPEYSPAGDRVTSVSARALYGCVQINAVQIPASVDFIGALAFANCPNLVYISVSDQNEEYCDVDGILYTSDGRALLLYPPMRAGNAVTLSVVTTEIMEMAFYNCAYLSHVYYTGSPEQWESISIGSKNYSLIAAAKTFSATK